MLQPLSASNLVDLWERGIGEGSVQRALLLLQWAVPELAPRSIAQLSIGQRNRLLLELRSLTFGEQLEMQAVCPRCHEQVELSCQVADMLVEDEAVPPETYLIKLAEYEVRFRLPNSLDLIAAARYTDLAAAHDHLLARCLLPPTSGDEAPDVARLPIEVVEALLTGMEQNDPQADMQLALVCPSCGLAWTAAFDIVDYFWSEIHAWAHETLRDVHALARAYGWRESEILSLSPMRRQLYLELIGA